MDPYHYGRYYNPYYNYQQNVIDSQIANVDQNMVNFGDMTDVNQDSNVYQSMSPEPDVPLTDPPVEEVSEPRIIPVV